ncbi:MAG: hypothetical protein KGK07_01500 [Chloroflexota bacterium]|nr:hypothetical protein [Chloroflexota bacterium]
MRLSSLLVLTAATASLMFIVERIPASPAAAAATCFGLAVTIEGTAAGEIINGTPGDDVINGLGGNDVINGLGGNDTICGGDGNDTLNGGDGNDSLDGGFGTNYMVGGAGDDYIKGGGGGSQYNTVDYSGAPGPINAPGPFSPVTGDGTDTLYVVGRIIGSSFDDVITGFIYADGGAGNDTITGDDGKNDIAGGPGNDTLIGLGDQDHFLPGPGDDVIDGGSGLGTTGYGGNYDTLDFSFATGPIVVNDNLGAGAATGEGADSFTNIENVIAGPFGDTITVADVFFHVTAGAGNDHIIASGAYSCCTITVEGGPGDDIFDDQTTGLLPAMVASYEGSAAGVDANLMTGVATGEGTDALIHVRGLRGSAFDDVLTGDDGMNYPMFGGAGNDVIHGNDGNDTIVGGPGDDTLDGGLGGADKLDYAEVGPNGYVAPAALTINLITGVATGDGTDTVSGFEGVEGSVFNDTITLDDGGRGAYGDTGNDTLIGGSGNDFLNGGGGIDNLQGNGGNDTIFGGGCFGACSGAGGDTEDGGSGDDTLYGSPGNDTITGGAGSDTLAFEVPGNGGPTSGVTVNLMTNTSTGDGSDTLSGIENVSGGAGGDTIIGDDGPNILRGAGFLQPSGSDNITGNGGNDTIFPGDGNDVADGGSGADVLDFDMNPGTSGVVVDLCAHTVTGLGSDTVTNFERVNGTFYDDTITGCTGNEYLYGSYGDDTLTSGGGTDTLDGGFFGTDTCNGDLDDTYIDCEIINNGQPPTPTPTPSPMPTDTATATLTPAATDTPVPTATDTPASTATPTATNTSTATPTATSTNTPVPTATDTPAPTATPTATNTSTATPAATSTNTPVPTATGTPTATVTATAEAAVTGTSTPPATNTVTSTGGGGVVASTATPTATRVVSSPTSVPATPTRAVSVLPAAVSPGTGAPSGSAGAGVRAPDTGTGGDLGSAPGTAPGWLALILAGIGALGVSGVSLALRQRRRR